MDNTPTLDGFVDWVRTVMGIPPLYLPDGSVYFTYAYNVALATVNLRFKCVPSPIYTLMVYNLGGANLMAWAQDVPGVYYKTPPNGDPIGYFAYWRQQYSLNSFTPGFTTAAYDQGTGTSIEIIDSLKNLTPGQIGLTKTPWGLAYLNWASDWNRPWGIS